MRKNRKQQDKPKKKGSSLSGRNFLQAFAGECLGIFLLAACNGTDKYYGELQALPQIDISTKYAYSKVYIVGDTMAVTGHLQPESNLQITIGGVKAEIVETKKFDANKGSSTSQVEDSVSVLITEAMTGTDKEVIVSSGGYTAKGPSIDVFSKTGNQTLNRGLKSDLLRDFGSDDGRIFLFCQSGKGDIFYYEPTTKTVLHLDKNGTESMTLDLSEGVNGLPVDAFLCGGTDPGMTKLYFSFKSGSKYYFYKLDLSSNTLSVLNDGTTALRSPYEGPIADIRLIVTGVYPASDGKIYLGIGLGYNYTSPIPDAVGLYDETTGAVNYLFKQLANPYIAYTGMPGTIMSSDYSTLGFRFDPDEKILYRMVEGGSASGFIVYDMETTSQISTFTTYYLQGATEPINPNVYKVFGLLSHLSIPLNVGMSDYSFGYLPMPGRRLQTLMYQNYKTYNSSASSYGFPKWITFDFTSGTAYLYATGTYANGGYSFLYKPNIYPDTGDLLLNYDEDGNLYGTAGARTKLVKTM